MQILKSLLSRNLHNAGSALLRDHFPTAQGVSFSTQAGEKPGFNLLFFCPRNEEHLESFKNEYPDFIKSTSPESISVTDTAHRPQNNARAITSLLDNQIKPEDIISHLVLMAHSKEETDQRIEFLRDSGIKSLIALRGNPATINKDVEYTHNPEGYESVEILMRRVKDLAPDMKLIVAGYPHIHPYAQNREKDLDILAKKVDAGADIIITQHFFDNNIFLRFIEDCQKRNIELPMIPSVMPIGNPKYLFAFSKGGGVEIPTEVLNIYRDDPSFTKDNRSINDLDAQRKAIEYTTRQLTSLRDLDNSGKIMRINTYTANNLPFMKKVFSELDLTKGNVQER